MSSLKSVYINAEPGLKPVYIHSADAGADCRSAIDVKIPAGKSVLVPLGFRIAIPEGYVGLLHSRSGMSLANRIEVANGVGVIDAGYTGEVNAHLVNNSDEDFLILKGDRVAQLLIQKVEKPLFKFVDSLPRTDRSNGGFGSTGRK